MTNSKFFILAVTFDKISPVGTDEVEFHFVCMFLVSTMEDLELVSMYLISTMDDLEFFSMYLINMMDDLEILYQR